jgi:diguanylate cyclase (GGDEF)-like protein
VTTSGTAQFEENGAETENVESDSGRQVDVVALGIVTAAILLFVTTGAAIGPAVLKSLAGKGPGPDRFLLNAFLLNIAIIIFGWSRYRQLCEEIRQRKRAERQARRLAETDPLTGFLNRRSFHRAVDDLIRRSAARDRDVVLAMIDLDNFKQVNDCNGHTVGDRLLQECARRISGCLPIQALISRIGGDEFAIALECDGSRTERIDRIAAALVEAIGRSAMVDTISVEVTASIGLAGSSIVDEEEARSNAAALLERADMAMYHASDRAGTASPGSKRRWPRRCAPAPRWNRPSARASHAANSCRSTNSRSISGPANSPASKCWRAGTRRSSAWSRRTSSFPWPRKSAPSPRFRKA